MSRPSEGKYLRAVLDAATRLLSQLDRDDLLTLVVREVVGIFGCREAGFYLTERSSSSLVLATRDSAGRQGEPLGRRCRMGEGAVGIAAETGQPYVYGESGQDNRGWEVAVPIKIGEEVIGVLDVVSWPGQLLDENILLPLELLANLSALALHARRLIRLNREGQDRLNAILNAADSAILLIDPEGIVRVANGKAGELFAMDPAVINGMSLTELLRENAGWRIKDLDAFQDWLSLADAISGLSVEERGMPGKCELEMSRHGKTAYFSAYLSPVTDAFGKCLGKILVISDVTDLRKAQRVLMAVSQTAAEINRNLDIEAILDQLMKAVKAYVPVDAMVILGADRGGRLTVLGARPEKLEQDVGVCGCKYEEKIEEDFLVDLISDLETSLLETREGEGLPSRVLPREFLTALYSHEMRSVIAVPLYLSGRMIGVWVLGAVRPRAYSYDDLAFLEPMAGHLAAAINNAMLLARTREMYRSSVRALAAAVDARDSYTMHHSEHVARLARAMAEEMGLGPEEVEMIEMAGLVHDVGKVGIPDAILNKPGPLSPAERSIMMGHAHIGASILARAGMMEELVPLVRHHHEWYDGSGYPDGLKGSEVPIGAWILAVADAFDTMISDRSYRPRHGLEEARKELRRMAGTQFHPAVVEALERVIEKARGEDAAWFKDIVQEGAESVGSLQTRRATLAEEAVEPINAREIRVLLRIVDEMRKLLDIRELMNHVVDIIHEEMGYRNCAVLLPDDTWSHLVIVASRGMSGGIVGLRLPKGTGISWWVMEHGLPQNIGDVTKDH
ncbi:MAG: GAF domain-containing protein, partial [Firmicutes bacterium]|nr:GAF domain-containing protein [Candidatus Fermentithermobacillaceae bacterium]